MKRKTDFSEPVFGNKTWREISFKDVLEQKRRRHRIIGMTFPPSNLHLGLEPSVLSVLPDGDNVEHCLDNRLFNDADVDWYLCSVYISGYEDFVNWALQHDFRKIIVGGYHPTTFPEEFTKYAAKVVRGPCDDFWATIKQKGQVVSGITSHKHLPRRDLYDIRNNQQIIPDKKPDDVVVSINTSMGCNNRPCDFCSTPIMCKRLVSRPIEIVEKELKSLVDYQPKFCFVRDENFTMQRDWRERLSMLHRYLPGTKLYLFASANTLDKAGVECLGENGVYMVCLGLEDPTVEYSKNKNLDDVVKLLKERRIMTYLSFIVNPLKIIGREEGESFYKILMKRIYELGPEMICGNFLMPFPGTGLWDKYYAFVDREDYKYYDSKTPFLVKNKIIREKMRFFLFWYQWQYYTSDFYNSHIRKFEVKDTLHLRFLELYQQFSELYERIWDIRP